MVEYKCDCSMGVSGLTCTKDGCGTPLEHKTITTDDGSTVNVTECPKCEGRIKSPMCCGADMEAVTS
ncbi:MAG: hypothetical protein FI685_05550 [SAR202 cluster bacterium]|nr:hypothetical protein [Dehalococcoidia bacterium]MDP7613032.1 hypothetical protein [Dehalococcoidia bacterium]MQG47540.1 hypothetical protein [SAR202 cluster bacterium]